MTAKRWPILDLDDGATEADIRRAYAKRLREQGPEADVASFQALRSEFEAALAAARPDSPLRVTVAASDARHHTRETTTLEPPRPPDRSAAAVKEITTYLAAGELVRACDRFDRARDASAIDVATSATLELELARGWLADTTLDMATLERIVERYRWNDVAADFPLGNQIVARLHAATAPVPRPGERFIGQWNWGAFLLTPFWLIAHGLRTQGIGFLALAIAASILPYGYLGVLMAAAVYGRRGTLLAVRNRRFADEAQFVAVQNAWRNGGIAVASAAGLCVALGIVWILRTFP